MKEVRDHHVFETMKPLWESESPEEWLAALQSYKTIIALQGSQRLPELDLWYREELPGIVTSRVPVHVTLPELVRITEWKMARGVWRARNLALVRGNQPADVIDISTQALAAVPHPTAPITVLSKMAGVGPATASAVVAATTPATYPFFDEIVASQIPQASKLVFNIRYYTWYAEALRLRAEQLGHGWNPVMVERAMWANAGGKVGRQHEHDLL